MSVIEEHRKRVGRQVRIARRRAGLTLDNLAAQVGSSRQHLIRIEKGQHLPRPDLLRGIAEATGKDESFFESDDDEEADPVASLDEFLRRRIRQIVREEARAL